MQSSYFGLLPKQVRHHQLLKPNAKLIFAEIMACLEDNGVCIKKNAYFSRVFNVSKTTISTSISKLREFGFINVIMEYEKGTHKLIKRYITPLNLFNEVGNINSNAYTSNLNGGSDVFPLENDVNESTQLNSLLYNNNKINKIYSDKKNKVILNRSINSKQREALLKVVEGFYARQSVRFPYILSDSRSDLINGSVNCLYELITIDKFDFDLIKDVINWAVDDEFWSQNLLSLRTLKNKSNNGMSKFANINHKYQNQ
jgi:hypothetical protein